MPQLLGCRMKTAQGLTVNPNDGRFLLSIGKGYHIQVSFDWDDSSFTTSTTNNPMKIAIIGNFNEAFEVLLLIAVSDHYERIGNSYFIKGLLNDPCSLHNLWIQQDESSPTEYRRIKQHLNGDIWKIDEDGLTASFGDLDDYKWWEDIFTEEYIMLG
jgi:hypothetical protein